MSEQQQLYREALSALQNRQRSRARDLLARLIKLDPSRAEYWLCMSGVVETRKEQIFCLKEAHRLEPENELAVMGLSIFGETPPGVEPRVRRRLEPRHWQVPELEAFQPAKPKISVTWKHAVALVGIIAILVVIGMTIASLANRKPSFEPISVLITSGPSPTFLPTQTPPASLVTASAEGPIPLADLLKITYTPTPLAVNTPHPASEDFRMAMRALERQDWEAMLDSLSFVSTTQPQAADVDYYRGEAYRFQGAYAQAVNAYEAAMAKHPELAAAYLGRARTRIAMGSANYRSARSDLEKALEIDPGLYEAWLEVAYLDLLEEEPQAALDALARVEELAPGSTMLQVHRARAYMLLDEPLDALAAAKLALENNLTYLPAYRLVGETALLASELDTARDTLQRYLEQTEDDTQAMIWLADVYAQLNQRDSALLLYDQALALDPRSYAAWYGRGNLFLKNGQFEQAESDLRKALVFENRSFEAHLALGKTLFAIEDYGNAYQSFSLAQAFAVGVLESAEMYYWRGQVLDLLNQPVAAKRDFQALLNLPDDDDRIPEAWLQFALNRLENGSPQILTRTPTPATPES